MFCAAPFFRAPFGAIGDGLKRCCRSLANKGGAEIKQGPRREKVEPQGTLWGAALELYCVAQCIADFYPLRVVMARRVYLTIEKMQSSFFPCWQYRNDLVTSASTKRNACLLEGGVLVGFRVEGWPKSCGAVLHCGGERFGLRRKGLSSLGSGLSDVPAQCTSKSPLFQAVGIYLFFYYYSGTVFWLPTIRGTEITLRKAWSSCVRVL